MIETRPAIAKVAENTGYPAEGAPPKDAFIAYPASWFPFCRSQDLREKPVSRRILGKELVAFRSETGEITVMNGQCSHLGAKLSGGCVTQGKIVCPYHGWKYNSAGECVEVPGQKTIPKFARQTVYPTVERHGFIFFFNGPRPTFELPFFIGEKREDYLHGRPFHFIAPCDWYMLGAHAFDQRHLEHVHERKLQGPLEIDQPAEHWRRARHESLVCGTNIFDRLIRLLAGNRVRISMSPVGGTFIIVTGDFRKLRSRFFLVATPQENGHTRVDGIVFTPRKNYFWDRFIAPLGLEVRRWFTKGYLVNEVAELGSHIYRPHHLVGEQDQHLIEYFRWVAHASRADAERAPVHS